MPTVKVRATFPNTCRVPSTDELFRVINHSPDYATLEITLASVIDRICTLQSEPTTMTLNLGICSDPQHGQFAKIVMNGVRAVAAQ